MRKPKFRISIIEGPTFSCTFGIGKKEGQYDVHRTGIALYLKVANTGSAPASIIGVEVGYNWAIMPFNKLWWKYGLFRYWLKNQSVCLDDFQVGIGEDHTKFFPFLTQFSIRSGLSAESHLDVGRSTNGIVYFEQSDSYGACFPFARNNKIKINIRVIDSYGNGHFSIVKIPRLLLDGARNYNPSFGLTLATLNSEAAPFDLPTDANGNLFPPMPDVSIAD